MKGMDFFEMLKSWYFEDKFEILSKIIENFQTFEIFQKFVECKLRSEDRHHVDNQHGWPQVRRGKRANGCWNKKSNHLTHLIKYILRMNISLEKI
jgi:hypothetical protein